MPRLWNDTIEAHRRDVHDAILDTTSAVVAAHGLRAVTMSRIAHDTGIGRATLYKYFRDVHAVLDAWHQRQITRHLARLAQLADGPGDPLERIRSFLHAYAHITQERLSHEHPGAELSAQLHPGMHASAALREVQDIVERLIAEGVRTGTARDDVPRDLLAAYCLTSLNAVTGAMSPAEVSTLITVILDGLRPPPR